VSPRVFCHRVEYGEEPQLVPSQLFYLSGCDLRCAFCIAELDAFDPSRGEELTSEFFNAAVAAGRSQGARNVQWVGGEPTIHLPAILEVMSHCHELPPIVWKSDFHCSEEAFELLDGVVETYVADFKFGNDRCAARLAGVKDYLRIVTRNLRIASRQGKLIVRHLLLPGHTDCCLRPILQWMSQNLPQAPLSLRDGYTPAWRADRFVELRRPIDRNAMNEAKKLVAESGVAVVQ
jgi:putative pyruvate formate lyase activating enzyme